MVKSWSLWTKLIFRSHLFHEPNSKKEPKKELLLMLLWFKFSISLFLPAAFSLISPCPNSSPDCCLLISQVWRRDSRVPWSRLGSQVQYFDLGSWLKGSINWPQELAPRVNILIQQKELFKAISGLNLTLSNQDLRFNYTTILYNYLRLEGGPKKN